MNRELSELGIFKAEKNNIHCELCKKELKKGVEVMKDHEVFICFDCDFSRHSISFQLMKNILELLEFDDLPNALPLLNKLDKLELRQTSEYELEDIPELRKKIKLSFFESLFRLNHLFNWRFGG